MLQPTRVPDSTSPNTMYYPSDYISYAATGRHDEYQEEEIQQQSLIHFQFSEHWVRKYPIVNSDVYFHFSRILLTNKFDQES